jgi:hypothetical protein
VWNELATIEDHVEWMADAVAIEFDGDQRRGVGTSFTCATRIGPLSTRDHMTITEWDEPIAIGVVHEGAVTGTGRFELRSDGPTTTITWHEQLALPWWLGGRLGGVLAVPVFRVIWRRNLARLAARVEGPRRS